MTEQLYLNDHYAKEFEATVVHAEGKIIELDRTLLCPEGGGQPSDTGILRRGEDEFRVLHGRKQGGKITWELDKEGLREGDRVVGLVDWERRYKLMRTHTAAHVISGYFSNVLGAKITGNQLSLEGGRIDFDLEMFDRDKLQENFAACNAVIDQDLPVRVYWKSREEVEQDPSLIKLAKGLPPNINQLRILDIVGFDAQADGGTHISHLREIGHVAVDRVDNKGKSNRRVYFKLV